MIDFPEATRIHRRLPKEAFYKHLPITTALKEKFVSDVDRIYIEWSLTQENLHLEKSGKIQEILILRIELKKKIFDSKIIEAIARQNPHKLIFVLDCEDERQLAVYHSKLYRSSWMPLDKVALALNGFSLDEILDNLIRQIALTDDEGNAEGLSIDEQLARKEKIEKLQKKIAQTGSAAWKEVQPKKKFELYNRLQEYKRKLEEIKNG